jgi:hypothetical protein
MECQQDNKFQKAQELDFWRREFQRLSERQCDDSEPSGCGNYQASSDILIKKNNTCTRCIRSSHS